MQSTDRGDQGFGGYGKVANLKISDDELRETIEANQLRLAKERGADFTIFSPRASFMAHHIGDFAISSTWASICNELCCRVSKIFPNNFIGAAMLPQSPGVDPTTCIPELERCVKEYGFVGINLNPDPSGGWWMSLPLADDLREDDRIRHTGDGVRLDEPQSPSAKVVTSSTARQEV